MCPSFAGAFHLNYSTMRFTVISRILLVGITLLNIIVSCEVGISKLEWAEKDEPVQLVRPDAKHKKLEVIEENLQLLRRVRGSVATVAVVGKFHSGKSFLMNQLMKKATGFGIGPTVKPQTMGIWMWGKPLVITNQTTGESLSVIFLDTEGFAANNISELYDAKIFAVATLLSSYLIYNSVKIIDQSDIDYLEILARRTQLFALRSQLSKSEWTNDFNRDLLSFPPLLWVVQDFVQTTDGFTPTEWLQQLMDSHSRESENYEISLLEIFKNVDCHTLFIPAIKKQLLIDLSQAKEEDLTEDYKMERDKLIDTLFKRLKPKEKNEKPITGPELVNLLKILVTAANEGSLSDVPTRWVAFIQHLQTTATEDCLKFYDAQLVSFQNQFQPDPVIPREFTEWHKKTLQKSVNLLRHLLQGLQEATIKSEEELNLFTTQKFDKAFDNNEKRIKLKCSELHSRLLLETEEKYGEIVLPMASVELKRYTVSIISQNIESFLQQVKHLLTGPATENYITNLKASLQNLGDSISLKNNKLIEEFLKNSAEQAKSKFEELLKSEVNEPRLPKTLAELLRSSTDHALNLYNSLTQQFNKESVFSAFLSLLKENLSEASKRVDEENESLVKAHGSRIIRELLSLVESQTSSDQIPLPMEKSELDARLNTAVQQTLLKFQQTMEDYKPYSVYADLKRILTLNLEKLSQQRRKENVEAFQREVSGPLKVAKSVILISADKYTTEFSVKQYMRKVCLLNLNEGKASSWPFELRLQVIENFFENDDELMHIVRGRQGWWSTIVGYIQWILYSIGLSGDK